MAIIKHKPIDQTVATIADRNAIVNRPDHLKVAVLDAVADVNSGGGWALYMWSKSRNEWIMLSQEYRDDLTFVVEEKVIAADKVTANYVPKNASVWDCWIQSPDGVLDCRPTVSVADIVIGSDTPGQYDGYVLHFAYCYGSFSSQIAQAAYSRIETDAAIATAQAAAVTAAETAATAAANAAIADKVIPTRVTDLSDGVNYLTAAATASLVNSSIQAVVGAAPAAIDTLEEIGIRLVNEEDAVAALTTMVSNKANTSSLAAVATSGSYNDLTNKPTIPEAQVIPADVAGYLQGTLTNGQVILKFVAVRAMTIPANLAGSYFKCETNPTASAVINIKKSGSVVASATLSNTGALTLSVQGVITLAPGDVLDIVGPATADATLAGVYFNIAGTVN